MHSMMKLAKVRPYVFGGQSLDSTGTYIDTVTSSIGCDSIVTLNLTVHPVYDTAYTQQICDGTTYDFNGTLLDSAGVYVDTLPTINGCDSVITLDSGDLAGSDNRSN